MASDAARRSLPISGLLSQLPPAHASVGRQGDIRYFDTRAGSILNTPESTGMDFWSINPYIGCAFGCAYCYARYAHRYAIERATARQDVSPELRDDSEMLPPWLAFERRVFVKRNAAAVLRGALRNGSERFAGLARGEVIVIGTSTDPYQPAERRFAVTRSILEVLAEHPRLRVSLITKSPLVTRDVDLLSRISRHSRLVVHISLITLDRELARRLEPRSPTPESRLRALERLAAAGIDAGINCMPVLPGITDRAEDLRALIHRCGEAGASHFAVGSLRLRATARERYLPVLAEQFPELVARYRRAYAGRYQLGDEYRRGLSRFVAAECRKAGIPGRSGAYLSPREESDAAPSDSTQLPLNF